MIAIFRNELPAPHTSAQNSRTAGRLLSQTCERKLQKSLQPHRA